MDLNQLANVGEFVGGIAVLATLVYLALQVRQGAEAQKATADLAVADALQRNIVAFSPFRQMLVSGVASDVWAKAAAGEELSAEEEIRLQSLVNELAWTAVSGVQSLQTAGGDEFAQMIPVLLSREIRMLGGANDSVRQMWDRVSVQLRTTGMTELAEGVASRLAQDS